MWHITYKDFNIREKVWLKAWCSCVRADNCIDKETPTSYADKCLEDFEERFLKEEE